MSSSQESPSTMLTLHFLVLQKKGREEILPRNSPFFDKLAVLNPLFSLLLGNMCSTTLSDEFTLPDITLECFYIFQSSHKFSVYG